MMTREQAEALGWTIDVGGGYATATNADGRMLSAGGGTPIFSIVALIAHEEGQPFALGYGGEDEVTADLIAAVSGETMPPVTFAEGALETARAAKAAAIQAVLTASDAWVVRAWEDGLSELPAPRAAYREQLRELLLQVQSSNDPAAIEIPTAPDWVPPTS